MSGLTTASTLIKSFAPEAVSAAKTLLANITTQSGTVAETVTTVPNSLNDSGLAQNVNIARELLSPDKNIANKLFTLSAHLSESHPEIASQLEQHATNLLNKVGLSDTDITFINDQLTSISKSETAQEVSHSETVNSNQEINQSPKSSPLKKKDIMDVLDLLQGNKLTIQQREKLVVSLKEQTLIPIAHIEENYLGHAIDDLLRAPQEITSQPIRNEQTVQDGNIATKEIPINLLEKALVTILGDNAKPLIEILNNTRQKEVIASAFSSITSRQNNFSTILNLIVNRDNISPDNFKTTTNNLFGLLGITDVKDDVIHGLHIEYNNKTNPSQPTTVSQPTEAPKAEEAKPVNPANDAVPSQDAQASNTDTETVLKHMLELISSKVLNRSGHVYMFFKWAAPVLNFFGMKLPTPEELPDAVHKYITGNPRFTNALKNIIENKEFSTEGMPWWQSWMLKGSKKLLGKLANNPHAILENGPQLAYAMRYGHGFVNPLLRMLPFGLGHLVSAGLPFVADELSFISHPAERERAKSILDVLAKYHRTEAQSA